MYQLFINNESWPKVPINFTIILNAVNKNEYELSNIVYYYDWTKFLLLSLIFNAELDDLYSIKDIYMLNVLQFNAVIIEGYEAFYV